jgi:hypothetical protein
MRYSLTPADDRPSMELRVGRDRFLPDPFEFIHHPTILHYIVSLLNSVVKSATTHYGI